MTIPRSSILCFEPSAILAAAGGGPAWRKQPAAGCDALQEPRLAGDGPRAAQAVQEIFGHGTVVEVVRADAAIGLPILIELKRQLDFAKQVLLVPFVHGCTFHF